MAKKTVKEYLQSSTDRKQLLALINFAKSHVAGENATPISLKTIAYFSNPNNENRYRVFQIKKKNGKTREIAAPHKRLLEIQTYLNEILKRVYSPSNAANGFVDGRSIITGAKVHVGHNYVLNIDLSDFFPSIEKSRVWRRLTLPPFNCHSNIANVIAGLCCIKVEKDGVTKYVLPQGAPTSPLLSNAICDNLDRNLSRLAKKFGVHYTRYADDMTFSSMHNVYQENSIFMNELRRIIERQHFKFNEQKTRLQKEGTRQEVTGITVNSKLNVAHKYTRDLRNLLYIWQRYGYNIAFKCFYSYYKKEKGHIKKGEPIMENVVEGKLNFLKMVKGETDKVYLRFKKQFESLRPVEFVDDGYKTGTQFKFIQSIKVTQFMENFNTVIEIRSTSAGGFIGKCSINNREVWVRISTELQKLFKQSYPLVQAKDVVDINISNYYITLCRATGKNFWLLTQKELKRITPVNIASNVNLPIDSILRIWDKYGIEEAASAFMFCAQNELSLSSDELESFMEVFGQDEIIDEAQSEESKSDDSSNDIDGDSPNSSKDGTNKEPGTLSIVELEDMPASTFDGIEESLNQ